MPFLKKKPFQRLHVSSDYKDDDEVFHCEVTNEVFKDYNEFCERIILCNSTIWSCSITGKTNMTFEEALMCEENAKKSLKEFPMELRIPILYLANRTFRTSFNEMIEDVYQFARDRYFVGEMVEASFTEDSWCECHVLQVIEPTELQIKTYNKENNRNPQERHYHPPAKLFRYEVEQLDCGESDVSQLMIVEAGQVRRRKQHYSRERNKIFLRLLCEQSSNGTWVVKESVQLKYGIAKVRFDTIFAGPLPDFTPQPKRLVKHKQETLDKFLTSDPTKHRPFDKPDPLRKLNEGGIVVKKFRKPRMNGKFKADLKARALEEKAKRKEERMESRERKKEEKQKLAALAAYVREWNKPREDLECEDLRPLHEPIPIKCGVPNERFGDFAMILEFLHFFDEELEVSTYFPSGINLDVLEKTMLVKETSGPWSDLLQLLLSSIFKYQAEEEDEIHAADGVDDVNMDHEVSSMAEAVKLATMASSWCQTQQGCQLSKITLDHVTLSEILRQHLLSSGGRISEAASKWRYSQRGGYTNHDDPALQMRMNEARILRTLGHRSVCEFDLGDRLSVAICLINQLLTFASIRDVIEERHEKVHQARRELKSFLIAEQKKEREEKEKMKEREKDGKVEPDLEQKPKKITRGNREEEKKREEYDNKLTELRQASRDDQMMLYLGADRAHRRYWRFLSIPGLFVENDEWWPGNCRRDGTPYLPELQDGDAAYTYLRNKFEDKLSDKENSVNKESKSPKKITFVDKNGIKSPRKDAKHDLTDARRSLMSCTGDKECPVHWKRTGPKWSFYGKTEDLEAVINGLNKRGIREGELKNNLTHETDSLLAVIENCPKHKLNPELFTEPPKDTTTKASKKNNKIESTNLNFPPDVAIDDVMELTLRDSILDLEDKLKVGFLGSLKVKDRDAWRDAITKGRYDKHCDKLVYGPNEAEADVPSHTTLEKIKGESRNSRPGTPDSEVGSAGGKVYRDPGRYLGPPSENESSPDPKQQNSIRQMACAILQLSNAVETKFLKKPVGMDDKEKFSFDESRERWEQSLMASTSWSQLFVHLNTLENKVAWGKSATNARCRICRRRRNAENMLLCDGCNKGHHLHCLKPKLTTVPEGDWFCVACKPRETKPKEKLKKRKKFEDESEEETTSLTKETRHNRAKRVPDSDGGDLENGEEDANEDDEEEDSEEELSPAEPLCTTCGGNGRLVACDACPQHFHIDCLEPPLSRVPRGKWICADCKNPRKHSSRITRGRERERDTERLCAAAARSRIHGFVKSLLTTESADWDDSSASEETAPRQTRRTAKRAATTVEEKSTTASLKELLTDIMHHRDSWPFLSPVTIDEVPDYHEYIKKPMDFGTIKTKLEDGKYETVQQMIGDCQLVFDNCHTYNKEHSSVYKAGMRLSKYFEKKCLAMGLIVDDDSSDQPPDAKKPRIEGNGLEAVDESDEDEQEQEQEEGMEEDEDEEEDEEEEDEIEEGDDDNDSNYES